MALKMGEGYKPKDYKQPPLYDPGKNTFLTRPSCRKAALQFCDLEPEAKFAGSLDHSVCNSSQK